MTNYFSPQFFQIFTDKTVIEVTVLILLFAVLFRVHLHFITTNKKWAESDMVVRKFMLKKNLLTIDPNFELVKGENIVYANTIVLIQMRRWSCISMLTKNVIITNLRIAISSPLPLRPLSECFGMINLWHPTLTKIPNTPSPIGDLREFGGGTMQIKTIELKPNYDNTLVWLKMKCNLTLGIGPITFYLLHPNAQEIFELFSKPIRD